MSNEMMVMENKPLTAVEIRANVNLIQEVMKAVMKKEIHYGVIPGTKKPTLYKAGSEKILSTFRIAVELDVEDLSTPDCFRYRVKARGVIPTGEIIGCGIGEGSTDEEKYKWRGVVCDAEWDSTPENRKRIKYSKPTDWNKTGETKQIRTNPPDLANTALKMAKKRAQIDLTLTATAASDVFDQDIEDLPPEYVEGMDKGAAKGGKPPVQQPQSKSGKPAELTEAQTKYFPRIEAALNTIYGPDMEKQGAKVSELTTWVKNKGKDNEETVVGTTDFRVLKNDKSLEILAHKLEQLAGKATSKKEDKEENHPEICANCEQVIDENGGGHMADCPYSGN